MSQTQQTKLPELAPLLEATINLRLATKEDIQEDYLYMPVPGRHKDKKRLRYGQPYFIRSLITGNVDATMRILNIETDKAELRDQFKNKMIYVPCGYFDTPATTQL